MADDKGKAGKLKTEAKHKDRPVLDDAAQKRHERLTLALMLEGMVAIVVGMFVISEFLSKGEASQKIIWIAGSLFGLFALGFLVTYFVRRAGDKGRA